MTDREITQAVAEQFKRDPGIDEKQITVTTSNGIVLLKGAVYDLLSKDRVARVAETVRGVRAVVNRLSLYTANRFDQDIEHDISNALLLHAATAALDVHATSAHGAVTLNGKTASGKRSTDGHVTLLGIADNLEAKLAAESIARNTVGVLDVRNDIQVKSNRPQADEARAERIRSALAIDQATRAGDYQLAGAVSGVKHVDAHLTVKFPDRSYVYLDYVDPYEPRIESRITSPGHILNRSDAQIERSNKTSTRSSRRAPS